MIETDLGGERFYTIPEVARILRVSEQSVRRWIKAGELPATKPKKEYRIAHSGLEEFLRAREPRPKAPGRWPEFEPSFNDVLAEERRTWELPDEEWLGWLEDARREEVDRQFREVGELLGEAQEPYFAGGTPSLPGREERAAQTDTPEWRRVRLLTRRYLQLKHWLEYLDERAPQDEAKLAEVRAIA